MRSLPSASVTSKRPDPCICRMRASIGSASQAISRPRSAARASARVSMSRRLYQGLPGSIRAGGAYSGTVWVALRTRLAGMEGA